MLEGNYDTLVTAFEAVLAVIAGYGGAPIIVDWLKARLDLSGTPAVIVTATVAVLITIITMVVDGAITADMVAWDNAVSLGIAVFMASQVRYNMLKGGDPAGDPADDPHKTRRMPPANG